MKLVSKLFTFFVAASLSLYADDDEGFKPLFDGVSLDGWTAARSKGEGDTGAFSVNKEEKAIHVYASREAGSKQPSDCLNTNTEFSHYVLKLEYKWLAKRFAPRADWERDSGLLFHVHGDLKRVWPLCLEMQIGESTNEVLGGKRFHTGDLFVLGKQLRATTTKKEKFYDPEGELTEGKSVWTPLGAEKPKGEWNEMEIRVHGAEKATFIFNGEVVHEIYDMKKINKDGSETPLDKGHIGIQAEWAEIMFRNIRIKELPAE